MAALIAVAVATTSSFAPAPPGEGRAGVETHGRSAIAVDPTPPGQGIPAALPPTGAGAAVDVVAGPAPAATAVVASERVDAGLPVGEVARVLAAEVPQLLDTVCGAARPAALAADRPGAPTCRDEIGGVVTVDP